MIDAPFGRPQRHVQDGSVLGDVDLLAAKHGVDSVSQPAFFRELQEQLQGFVGDAVLRVVEVETEASAVKRSPRLGSSAKSWRRWSSRTFWWCASRAFQPGRPVRDWIPAVILVFLSFVY